MTEKQKERSQTKCKNKKRRNVIILGTFMTLTERFDENATCLSEITIDRRQRNIVWHTIARMMARHMSQIKEAATCFQHF